MERLEQGEPNWSERVEDLVEEGELDKAIAILESQVQTLTTVNHNSNAAELDNLQLSSALSDLAPLYAATGFSLKADHARSRARDLKIELDYNPSCPAPIKTSASGNFGQSSAVTAEPLQSLECRDGHVEKSPKLAKTALPGEELSNDDADWEAMADRAPDELLSSQSLSKVSKPLLKEKVVKLQTPKRRGRGKFSYTAHGLHNNQQSDGPIKDNLESETACRGSERDTMTRNVSYGTRHVVILADFPPSTTTIDLENLLKNFKDHRFVIRWVNDTVALAVFRSPTIALEACNQIQCPFTARVLEENDPLLNSIPSTDLEPPRERPKTSTRVATRLIAQGMGIKMSTAGFGSKELKKQEQARRDRIVSRQNMRDDAWGDNL